MPKARTAPQLDQEATARPAELDPRHAVASQLEKIIADLDNLDEGLAAAYAQMALDMLRH